MERDRDVYDEVTIDLKEIFYILRKRVLLIVLAALIGGLAAGIISAYFIDHEYSSTSKLYVLTSSTSITSIADVQVGSSLASDYVELIKSRPVVEQVITDLKLDMTYEGMLAKLTVENPPDTRILNISFKHENPYKAKEIVDDFATVSQEKMAEIMKTEEPSIVEKGVVAKKPASPNVKMNILIGLLLGLLASMMYAVVRYMMDDTIKTAEDVEKYLGLNTLTVIPVKNESGKEKTKKLYSRKGKKKHGK